MAKVILYNQKGENVGDVELSADLFSVPLRPTVVHEAVVGQQANARHLTAHTKRRGEVRGGGRKPWKQKGTGRARQGSIRAPQWKGGGVTFGPNQERSYTKKINRRVRRAALAMCLSEKVREEKFLAVDTLKLDTPKTKRMAAILASLPSHGRKTLVLLEPENAATARATRNLPKALALRADSINVADLLANEYILASQQAIEVLMRVYGSKKAVEKVS